MKHQQKKMGSCQIKAPQTLHARWTIPCGFERDGVVVVDGAISGSGSTPWIHLGWDRLLLLLAISEVLLPSLETLRLLLLLLLLLEATELLLLRLSHAPAKMAGLLVVKALVHLSISLATATPKTTTVLMTAVWQE